MIDLSSVRLEDLITEVSRRRIMIEEAGPMLSPWRPEVRRILAAVAPAFGVTIDDLLEPTQRARIAKPRQCAMTILRERLELSLVEIGMIFGKDHGTVIHAIKAHASRIATDFAYARKHAAAIKALDTPAR